MSRKPDTLMGICFEISTTMKARAASMARLVSFLVLSAVDSGIGDPSSK
jgi:hypothetical protein